ncbi:MAG: ATP-binding cassette domain-containing protein [Dysosmobacter sp.]
MPCTWTEWTRADEKLLLEIRRRTGMVFQNPDNQIVANVVEEDVAFGPENLGVPTAEIRRRVDDALAAVGMEQFASHAPHLLSGGQKQRIAIAGILAMEPECIVLDEATAMLDPAGRREVIDTVLRLNREQGITVVLITHHMVEAERADRVIVMNDGEVAMDGTPRQVFCTGGARCMDWAWRRRIRWSCCIELRTGRSRCAAGKPDGRRVRRYHLPRFRRGGREVTLEPILADRGPDPHLFGGDACSAQRRGGR